VSSCHGQCSPSVAHRVSIDRHHEPLMCTKGQSITPLFFARKNNSAPFTRDDSADIIFSIYAAIYMKGFLDSASSDRISEISLFQHESLGAFESIKITFRFTNHPENRNINSNFLLHEIKFRLAKINLRSENCSFGEDIGFRVLLFGYDMKDLRFYIIYFIL